MALAAARPASAARWWRLPLWGAEVRAFTVDPFEPDVIYLGTSRGNFYGSTDGGVSWKALHDGPGFTGYVGQEFVPKRDPMTSLAQAVKLCNV